MASDNALFNKIQSKVSNSGTKTSSSGEAWTDWMHQAPTNNNDLSFLGGKVKDALNSGGSTTPTGTGSSGASSAGAISGDYYDPTSQLAALYAQQKADAEAAYNRAMNNLDSAYGKAYAANENIYNSGRDQLGRSYNYSRGKINSDAEDAFRQAYVNRMLSEKNLGQRLAAMGMSGGASESTMAGLINNYGNARSGIQRTLDTNLGDLANTYQSNLTDLYRDYWSNRQNLETQRAAQANNLAMQLASLNANMGGDYYSALMSYANNLQKVANSAVAKQAGYSAPLSQEVTNALTPANVKQANDMGASLTNAAYDAWKRNQDDEETTRRAASLFDNEALSKYADYLSKGLLGSSLLGAFLG